MAYTLDTVDRYLPGGDIYDTLEKQYGSDAAYSVAEAASTGDQIATNNALNLVKNGKPLNSGFWSTLGNQVATDVTAAPASYFNDQIKKVFSNIFTNPFLLIAIAVALFFMFGGAGLIRRKIN